MSIPCDAHTLVLDLSPKTAMIEEVLGFLIYRSQWAGLLRADKVTRVNSVEQFKNKMNSKSLIVAGTLTAQCPLLEYNGPYDVDFHEKSYDELTCGLLDGFDWAFFSYFTTYHDCLYTLIARQSGLCEQLLALLPVSAVIGRYSMLTPNDSYLKNATFYDHDVEGLHVIELARERQEEKPLLLCSVNANDPGCYRLWNGETNRHDDEVWYEAPLSKLEQVELFCVGGMVYTLHRINDLDAYLYVWSMASRCSIARATLSEDADIQRLRASVSNTYGFDVIRQSDEVASWAYGHIYGGGSDEYHAVFHARDAAITQRIWEFVGESGIARF